MIFFLRYDNNYHPIIYADTTYIFMVYIMKFMNNTGLKPRLKFEGIKNQ